MDNGHKSIGCLLVGIVTNNDIFHFFIDAFGVRHRKIRITINFREKPGQLTTIARKSGNIAALVTSERDDIAHRWATLKITGTSRAIVEAAALSLKGSEIEDLRE